jgi:ATP-dependent RNA helicase DOB1
VREKGHDARHELAARELDPARLGIRDDDYAPVLLRACDERDDGRRERVELRGRRRVLRKLGYLDEGGVVSAKGRVAAEVASADGLLVTELMYGGALSLLTPAQLAALASCLIWREKGASDGGGGGGGGGGGRPAPKLPDELAAAHAALRDTARRVARVEAEYGLRDDVDDYVAGFSGELMTLVAAWAGGARFSDLLAARGPHNALFEGSVVRAIRRIEELLRQLAAGAAGVGEAALAATCTAAAAALKRDIVFSASLFL